MVKRCCSRSDSVGSVPHVIPNVLGANANGSTGWADAATIIPWNMYLAYGDKRILEDQYRKYESLGWLTWNITVRIIYGTKDFILAIGFFTGHDDDNDGRSEQ